MYSDQPGDVSVLNFAEKLFVRRWRDHALSQDQFHNLKRLLRLCSINVYFRFLRGPHKFSIGTYPKPSKSLYRDLLAEILSTLQQCQGEKYTDALERLLGRINTAENLNVLLFLFLISNVKPKQHYLGLVHIPDDFHVLLPPTNERLAAPYPFEILPEIQDDILNNRALIPHDVLGERYTRSDFSRKLNFDFKKPTTSHYFGAFTCIGPEAQVALSHGADVPLRIPPFSTDFKIGSELFHLPTPSQHSLSKPQVQGCGDADERFESSQSQRFPENHTSVPPILSAILAQATPCVGTFILTRMYSSFVPPQSSVHNASSKELARYCWANRGCALPSRELPFITEQKSWGTGALVSLHRQHSSMDLPPPETQEVWPDLECHDTCASTHFRGVREAFYRDLLLLRLGIQSSRFLWRSSLSVPESTTGKSLDGSFVHCPQPSDHVLLNISDIALRNLLTDHLKSGTYYRRLCWFVREVVLASPGGGSASYGPTFVCFTNALNCWLMAYEEAVQRVMSQQEHDYDQHQAPHTGLLGLTLQLRTLSNRIRFISELCMLQDGCDQLPLLHMRGITLLRYLLSKAGCYISDPAEPIIRFLFKRSCVPLLRFLERFVYDGVCDESGLEFNLPPSIWPLLEQGLHHVCKPPASNPCSSSSSRYIDLLPAGLEHRILCCALSVRLLKFVAPKHFIFSYRTNFPSLRFPCCFADLEKQKLAIIRFSESLHALALEVPNSRDGLLQKMHSGDDHDIGVVNSLDGCSSTFADDACSQSAQIEPLTNGIGDVADNSPSALEVTEVQFPTACNSSSDTRDTSHFGCDSNCNGGFSGKQTTSNSSATILSSGPVKLLSRFHQLNRHGHASDSTIQHMLYGSGSGPACRPSVWDLECAARDAINAQGQTEQPDTDAYILEALQVDPPAHASIDPVLNNLFASCEFGYFANPYAATLDSVNRSKPHVPTETKCDPSNTNLELLPLQGLLEKVVLRPILVYANQVDTICCNYFLRQLGLLNHVQTLRQICFFEHGEFTRLLLEGLFSHVQISTLSDFDDCNSDYLHDLIVSVAQKFTSATDASDLVELSSFLSGPLRDILTIRAPIDLVKATTLQTPLRTASHVAVGLPVLFDSLTLVYEVPWPLCLIIHTSAMERYNLVFRQLLRVKFAIFVLNRSYHQLRSSVLSELTGTYAAVEQMKHSITLWIYEMTQVVRGLECYLSNQAVKTNWAKFFRYIFHDDLDVCSKRSVPLRCAKRLEDVVTAHDEYLDAVIRCCLLGSTDQEIQTVFLGLLSSVICFCQSLFAGHWIVDRTSTGGVCAQSVRYSTWERLSALHLTFRQHARFLLRRASRLLSVVRPGVIRSSLSQLIISLGINDFYSVLTE